MKWAQDSPSTSPGFSIARCWRTDMTDVVMPQMGESIVEGTLTKWLKKAGERIERDEPLFEISTDKVDTEIPSPAAGTLAEILVEEGKTVGINTVVARIDEVGQALPPAKGAAAPAPAEPTPAPVAAAPPAPQVEAPSVGEGGSPAQPPPPAPGKVPGGGGAFPPADPPAAPPPPDPVKIPRGGQAFPPAEPAGPLS